MSQLTTLELILSYYPILSTITPLIWDQDLINLALASRHNYSVLRKYSEKRWDFFYSHTMKGCKFDKYYEYDHRPNDYTPTPVAYLSKQVHGCYSPIEFPELDREVKASRGVCATCRDRICRGCTEYNKISDVIGFSPFSPLKTDLIFRRIRHHCASCRSPHIGISICRCDVMPLKHDDTPWICPPCSFTNHDADLLHQGFQENCVDDSKGLERGTTKMRKARMSWEESIDESFVTWEEQRFCECGKWGTDGEGVELLVCSWCKGEVKLEW